MNESNPKSAQEVLEQILSRTLLTDPVAILEEVMTHPKIPMNGSVHYALVSGSVVTAVRNTGYALPGDAVQEALARAGKLPKDCCGLYGICGSAVGAGIAVSVITGATPVTVKQRSLALSATSYAASFLLDELPRCGLRESRIAIMSAVDFLRDFVNIDLPRNRKVRCVYLLRNDQCAEEACPFFAGHGKQELSASYHD